MSIWNKILIGLIFVALLPFFYMAARTLKTHQHWREKAQAFQQQIAKQDQLHEVIQHGTGGEDLVIEKLRATPRVNPEDPCVIPPEMAVVSDGAGTYKTYKISGTVAGLNQVTVELAKLVANRGRVWRGCEPQQVDPATGLVSLKIGSSAAHGITVGTKLFVFEEDEIDETQFDPRYSGDELAAGDLLDPNVADPNAAAVDAVETTKKYLGEFLVIPPPPGQPERPEQVDLVPAAEVAKDSYELQRLANAGNSGGKWTLYENMPADGHDVFTGADEERMKEILPASVVAEYLKDGQIVTIKEVEELGLQGKVLEVEVLEVGEGRKQIEIIYEDSDLKKVKRDDGPNEKSLFVYESGEVVPEDKIKDVHAREVADGKGLYVRPLRDYKYLFDQLYLQRSELYKQLASTKREAGLVQAAEADARLHEQFREREITGLKTDKDAAVHELGEVAKLGDTVQKSVAELQKRVAEYIARNYAIAYRIERIQELAAEQINARTRNVAEANRGPN